MVLSRRLILAAAAVGALALAGCNQGGGASGPSAGDMSMGDPNAPVKMVEYASASCGHCATFNNEVFPAFKAKYVDTGKVHYTLKEFITPPEQLATAGFLLARCAGKDKYFSVLDAVFHSHEEIGRTGDIRGVLLRIGQSAGLSEAQFNACLTNEAEIKALDERVTRHVREDKITGTPTFFINGKKVGESAMTLAELEAAVAEAQK